MSDNPEAKTTPRMAPSWRVAAMPLAVALAGAFFFAAVPPGRLADAEAELRPPFQGNGGLYSAAVELPAAARWNRGGLPAFKVLENGRELSGALDLDLFSPGAEGQIVFRTSDGSDPNGNGRQYAIRYKRAAVPIPVWLAAAVLALGCVFLLAALAIETSLGRHPILRRAALAAASIVFGAALFEALAAILLADRLAGSTRVRTAYEQALRPQEIAPQLADSANFEPHPYLNYVLNPGTTSASRGQIDAHYRIRRTEPIRPRADVAWRALVLGGSTTFGEGIAREEDTWVYRLEKKIRDARGPAFDVVNGGVSWYHVVDNFLHYVLLLDDLEPDVVLLFVGINDVHVRLTGDIARDYTNNRIAWRGDLNTLPAVNRRLERFASYRYWLLLEVERRRLGHIYQFVQVPYPPPSEWAAALARNGPQYFRAHLTNLVRLISAEGRKVVLIPQVMISKDPDNPFAAAVREHNRVAESVARELRVPFVAEVENAFQRTDLIDDAHFNARGNEKMADILLRALAADWRSAAAH